METKKKYIKTKVRVIPGVCGFNCSIVVFKKARMAVGIEIFSECERIQDLDSRIQSVDLKGVLAPISKNSVFKAAEEAKCHSSCPVPVGIIKAAEVALDLAIPKDARLEFGDC